VRPRQACPRRHRKGRPPPTARRCTRAADIADKAQLDAFLDGAHATFGRIDVLVNNASGFGTSDDEAGWKTSFDVDVASACARPGRSCRG
jgi:NAD(P)-dependent dehydrogenase (short-subunit alcohol dehydrogenase family)